MVLQYLWVAYAVLLMLVPSWLSLLMVLWTVVRWLRSVSRPLECMFPWEAKL